VTGNVNAKSIFTAGGIVVGGDLILRDSLVGDYNDSGTFVFGKLEACFVFTSDYFFEFYGDVNAKYVVSDVSYELALGTKVTKCNDMLLSDFFKLLHPSFLKSIDTKSTVFLNSPVVKALVHYFDVSSLYRYISQGNTLFNE